LPLNGPPRLLLLLPFAQEIEWILNEVKTYLSPELRVRRSDVLSAWYGWRPLASDPNALPGAPISRDHIISTQPQTGTTFITGGKWTTYREMAEDVRAMQKTI
jgi:glycerol-3-phosphate dehydrogenase